MACQAKGWDERARVQRPVSAAPVGLVYMPLLTQGKPASRTPTALRRRQGAASVFAISPAGSVLPTADLAPYPRRNRRLTGLESISKPHPDHHRRRVTTPLDGHTGSRLEEAQEAATKPQGVEFKRGHRRSSGQKATPRGGRPPIRLRQPSRKFWNWGNGLFSQHGVERPWPRGSGTPQAPCGGR